MEELACEMQMEVINHVTRHRSKAQDCPSTDSVALVGSGADIYSHPSHAKHYIRGEGALTRSKSEVPS